MDTSIASNKRYRATLLTLAGASVSAVIIVALVILLNADAIETLRGLGIGFLAGAFVLAFALDLFVFLRWLRGSLPQNDTLLHATPLQLANEKQWGCRNDLLLLFNGIILRVSGVVLIALSCGHAGDANLWLGFSLVLRACANFLPDEERGGVGVLRGFALLIFFAVTVWQIAQFVGYLTKVG